MKHVLEPYKSISSFEINKLVTPYLKNCKYLFKKGKVDESWDTYYFFDEEIIVHVDKMSSIIESIGCKENCYLRDVNLIGLEFTKFLEIVGKDGQNFSMEKMWMNDSEQQIVYDLDNLPLQVWVSENKLIVSVYLLNL